MQIGQVVYSKKGRDKGRALVVMGVEGEYVFLADGQLRPLNKLKKKKAKHTQLTHTVIAEVTATSSIGQEPGHSEGMAFCEQKRAEGGLTDADIRKWLAPFQMGSTRNKIQNRPIHEEVSNCQRTT